jgi:benzylsuccinate CoA-transferase BbsF subunit
MALFEGVKVIDLGWGIVTPLTTRFLANHGAVVIRVESSIRVDPIKHLPPFPGKVPGLNRGHEYNTANTSKLGVGINLASAEGLALARRLCIEWAEVVASGFAPGVVEKWGLDYEGLKEERPDIIVLNTSVFGKSGPFHTFAGWGNLAAATAGFYEVTGWPEGGPQLVHGAYTDIIAPRFNALIIAAVLDRRRRTGQGANIDVSQVESAIHLLFGPMLEWTANDRLWERRGNRSNCGCPHGTYPCAGEDRWISIAVHRDEHWKALCHLMQRLDILDDPRYSTFAARYAHEDELDELIAAWTRSHDAFSLFAELQATGVPSGVVQNAADLQQDPQLRARGYFVTVDHKEIGPLICDGEPTIATERAEISAAPCIGQHNLVLRDILGLSMEEFERLQAEGVIQTA